jgi:hypothetical protein
MARVESVFKWPVFDGKGTVECFFCVEERFDHCPETFKNFEEVHADTAPEKQETQTRNATAAADQTTQRCARAVKERLLERVDPLAKDCMIKHEKDFRRPVDWRLSFAAQIVFQARSLTSRNSKRRT